MNANPGDPHQPNWRKEQQDLAERVAAELRLPVVVRPAYTLGGTGGGLAYNLEELRTIVNRGITTSRISQVLIEKSVEGWEELELEVLRDARNQMITVCFIENVDAMGVHTSDSFCVAPMLTIAPELQGRLQDYSYRIMEAIKVVGGCNIQFAHSPTTQRQGALWSSRSTQGLLALRHSRQKPLASPSPGFRRCSPPALPLTNCPTGALARWTSTPLPTVTTLLSNSPAGHSRSSGTPKTDWELRCALWAKL